MLAARKTSSNAEIVSIIWNINQNVKVVIQENVFKLYNICLADKTIVIVCPSIESPFAGPFTHVII